MQQQPLNAPTWRSRGQVFQIQGLKSNRTFKTAPRYTSRTSELSFNLACPLFCTTHGLCLKEPRAHATFKVVTNPTTTGT
jgi:hypothetical protein